MTTFHWLRKDDPARDGTTVWSLFRRTAITLDRTTRSS